MPWQPYPSYVGGATAPRVAGRNAGDAPGLQPPEVHVELAGEDQTLAPDVLLFVRSR